jgi:transglutaminase-like putative cysteine protease
MKLHIEHTTTFAYEEPISEAYTEMRLRPLESAGQRCLWFTLTTEPGGEVMHYTDRYGNLVHHFDTLQSHDRVVVKAISEVYLTDGIADDQRDLSPLDQFDYLAPAKYTPLDEQIRAFAAPHIVADDQTATAFALMRAIYSSLIYERGATDVGTTAPEALALGRGVCQDFAHIMLAACRGAGIPARYVSGYLYNPKQSTKSQASGMAPANTASHAWVDVFTNARGWISLDPTHNCGQTTDYVRVGVGRDYSDVPPTRGVYKGQAKETLTVDVSVRAA